MHISIVVLNLVILSLIYVSSIETQQQYRGGGGLPMDDLVAAIATAAINGAIPFNKLNLANPNRKGEALRIPILLIRPNDLRQIKNGKMKFNGNKAFIWNPKNGRSLQNDRDFLKKDFSPKPKFPTHGLKVIPAPKLEFDSSALKKNFDKKPVKAIQINNRFPDRERDEEFDRYPVRNNNNNNNNNKNNNNNNNNNNNANRFTNRINEERLNRNRLNTYNTNSDRFNDERYNNQNNERQNERFPIRQTDRVVDRRPTTIELPEKEPPNEEPDDYDDRPVEQSPPLRTYAQLPPLRTVEQLPSLKPVIKTPSIVRHVYGAPAPIENEKPTIPPRYLKSITDVVSQSSSENYENSNNNNSPLQKVPSLSQLFPPLKEEGLSYKSEPLVNYKSADPQVINHKYVNLGDVYRKANSEEEEEDITGQEDSADDEPLAGYGKDPYDKQLINTLKNLMASSKDRHPLNIGGITGADKEIKPVTKSTKQYVHSGGQTSVFRDDLFTQKVPQSYSSSSPTQNQQLIPQSYTQYLSPSQTSSQSKKLIPESVLRPLSFSNIRTLPVSESLGTSQSGIRDKYLSNDGVNQMVHLRPGQVPLLPEVSRKPVALDLDYNTGVRPLSPNTFFSSDSDGADDYGNGQSRYVTKSAQVMPQQYQQQNDYQTAQQSQPLKTYVVTGNYRKTGQEQDRSGDLQYEDKATENSEISESYAQINDEINYPSVKSEAQLEPLKQPIYVQLGQNLFFELGPKGNLIQSNGPKKPHLINSLTANHRPSQKVSKNLLFKPNEQNVDKLEILEEFLDKNNNKANNHNNNLTFNGLIEFSCENRSQGYYVDVRHNCQIYYQCYLGGSYKFSCPNGTQFDEQRLLCDWPENVLCGTSDEKTPGVTHTTQYETKQLANSSSISSDNKNKNYEKKKVE